MKLFAIETDGKIVKETGFFSSKAEAKKARDAANGGTPAELKKQEKKPKFTVTVGPDHFRS